MNVLTWLHWTLAHKYDKASSDTQHSKPKPHFEPLIHFPRHHHKLHKGLSYSQHSTTLSSARNCWGRSASAESRVNCLLHSGRASSSPGSLSLLYASIHLRQYVWMGICLPATTSTTATVLLDHLWAVECDAVVMCVRCNQIVLAATAWFESFCWGGHVVVVAGLRRDYTAWRKKYSTTLHIIWMYRLDYIGPSLTNMKKLHLTLNTVNWSHILTYDSLSSSSLQTS